MQIINDEFIEDGKLEARGILTVDELNEIDEIENKAEVNFIDWCYRKHFDGYEDFIEDHEEKMRYLFLKSIEENA